MGYNSACTTNRISGEIEKSVLVIVRMIKLILEVIMSRILLFLISIVGVANPVFSQIYDCKSPDKLVESADRQDLIELSEIELSSILEKHKKWTLMNEINKEKHQNWRANLCNVRLDNRELDGAVLFKANLANASLKNTKLNGANLHGANLNGAILINAELDGALLDGAMLNHADMKSAKLNDATLVSAKLLHVNLTKAELNRAKLMHAEFSIKSSDDESYSKILRKKDFSGKIFDIQTFSNLESAKLVNANLTSAYLNNANLNRADLTGALLAGAELINASFVESKLADATLSNSKLHLAKLVESKMSNTKLRYAKTFGLVFEPDPSSLPEVKELVGAEGISQLTYQTSRQSLVTMREELRKSGIRGMEREITYAIKRADANYALESKKKENILKNVWVKFLYYCKMVLFERTTGYGMYPQRSLYILALVILFCSMFYFAVLKWPGKYFGSKIFKIVNIEDPSKRFYYKKKSIVTKIRVAIYYSFLSAFHFGWRDINAGTWLERMQPSDFRIQGVGFARTVSGLQSVIGLYLIAIWALTYFGRPFG